MSWRRLYWPAIAAGTLGVAGLALAPRANAAAGGLLVLLSVATTVAVAAAAARRGERHLWLLAAGEALNAVAWALWYPGGFLVRPWPSPGLPDALFIVAYLVLIAGLVALVTSRSGRRDTGSVFDTAIITTGFATVAWAIVIAPALQVAGPSLAAEVVAIAYPLMDVVLFGYAVRLVTMPGRRQPALWLIVAWLAVQLVADAVYAVQSVDGTFTFGSPVIVVYGASFVCLAAAALHPGLAELGAPVRSLSVPSRWRLVPLTVVCLLPFALIAADAIHGRPASLVVVGAGVLLAVLSSLRMRVLLTDLRERRRLLDELSGSEERIRSLVEHLPGFSYTVALDQPDRLVYISPQAAAILGGSVDDWHRASTWEAAIHPDDRPPVLAAWRRATERGKPFDVEYRMVSGTGATHWFSDHARVAASGRVLHGVAIDVTEAHRADEAMRASEAKSRFLASMSHELRTPLNSVLGFAQLLEEGVGGDLTPRHRRYVEHITSSGRHLLQLINDVLDLAKVQSGALEVGLETVAVSDAVQEVVEQLQPLAQQKSIRLLRDAERAAVRADPRRLQQVLLNVVGNAVKFTPEGGRIELTVSQTGDRVRVRVADTGPGVGESDRQRIFEEFTQVSEDRKRAHEGTGLGLPLSRRLARLMGGDVELETTSGAGSVFVVELAAAPAPAALEPAGV